MSREKKIVIIPHAVRERWQRLCLGSFWLLITTYTLNAAVHDHFTLLFWGIPCLTLLPFLPGLQNDRTRTYNWLCFVVLMHFTVGVTLAMGPNGHSLHWIQVALCIVLFISTMMTSRALQRQPRSENR